MLKNELILPSVLSVHSLPLEELDLGSGGTHGEDAAKNDHQG